MSRRKVILLAVICALIVLSAASAAVARTRDRGPQVRTETVTRRDLVSTVTASGYIQPRLKVDISADISGRVTDLYVEEGQWVEQGTVLLRIDRRSYEAAVNRAAASVAQARAQAAQARANLLRAQSELNRAEQLAPQNLISPSDLEQARTQLMVTQAQMEATEHGVAQADASLSEANDQLRKTTISAPMSGHVVRLNIEVGETAIVGTMNNAGSLLLTIADLSEMEARVRVGETDIPDITLGDSALVRVDAYPGQTFAGKVTRIANSAVNAPAASSQTAQAIDFEVVVTVSQPPKDLRPDLTATADIITDQREQAISVPIIAVTVRDGEGRRLDAVASDVPPDDGASEVEGVFVLDNGTAVWTPVRVGIVSDWYFEVVSGLSGGETVISGPYTAVRDLVGGETVRTAVEPATTK
ncbi:MAG: efflux RND transporter periplasmic adaptor subunit [Gemmatimonadota bacterium]|nr:efflux RND transporter periplasmic adaptor subunit [Gemmatimonadota bacterium]